MSLTDLSNPHVGCSAKQIKILIVDDDTRLCESTSSLLAAEGYQTETAYGGAEALAALGHNHYPLMLLDLDMPEVNGLAVMEQINQQQIDTAVIIFSGESDVDKALQVVKAGARDFVRKPSNPAELLLAVRNLLEKLALEKSNRQMIDELQRSEDLHRFIVCNSPDLMFLLDKTGELSFANNARDLLGYSDQEVIGKHFSQFVHPKDLNRVQHFLSGKHKFVNGDKIEIRLQDKSLQNVRHVEIIATRVARRSGGGTLLGGQPPSARQNFIGIYGVARDITDKKRSEEIIRYQHNHDILTSLPNRGLLNDRLAMLINHASRRQEKAAVLYLDIDRFKLINDTYGQIVGDELLQSVAEALQRCIRKEDTLSRFGGDEFVLLLPGISSATDAEAVAEKIIQELSIPFHLHGHEIHISISLGIALYPEHGQNKEELLKNADTAVCNSRLLAKSNYCRYHQALTNHSSEKVSKENLLRQALKNDQVVVHYQPQIDLTSGRIHAVEALVRITAEDGGLVLPGQFIPIAEESSLINDLGDAVFEKVFQDVKNWQRQNIHLPVAINISAKQLVLENFSDAVLERIKAYDLDPEIFELELTENVIIQNLERTMANLEKLTHAGFKIAIDDFGKGYSSLSYLDQLPIDTLKLDKLFIKNLHAEPQKNTIIPAIINVSQGLQLQFIVEGVETERQHNYLTAQQPCIAQGFYYCRPTDPVSLLSFIRSFDFDRYECAC